MRIYADKVRHLICVPYTKENLHLAAESLGIKRCWYHANPYPHYDIPKKSVDEVLTNPIVHVVSAREIMWIIKREMKQCTS